MLHRQENCVYRKAGANLSSRTGWPINKGMLDKRTLARINDRPRGRGSAAYAALGAVVAAVAAGLLISYAAAAVLLFAGGAGAFLLHRREVEARTTRLGYDLDGEAAVMFDGVREACKALSGARRTWRIEEDAVTPVASSDDTVLTFDGGASRHSAEIGLMEPPGISANIDIWGIKTDAMSLYFLPEGVLSYKDDHYRAVAYDALGVTYRPSRTAEYGEVPEDAETVGQAWRFVKADGKPDLRSPQNQRYDLVLYGLLSITGTEPRMRLLVSNKAAAVGFARAFGAGRGGEPRQDAGSAREERARREAEAKADRTGSLLKVLGVSQGASRKEIDAAYKKQAKMYHPDRVASLAPEVREMSELRMKEINAAYDELKRQAR